MAEEKTYPMDEYKEGFEPLVTYTHFRRNSYCDCYEADYYGFSRHDDEMPCDCDDSGCMYGVRVDCAVTKKPKGPEDTTFYVHIYKTPTQNFPFWDEDGREMDHDVDFEDKHLIHSFTVYKVDDAGWEPASQEMAATLVDIINKGTGVNGYFTCNKAGFRTYQYISTFKHLSNAMAEPPKNVEKNEECAHVKQKRKAVKSKSRRK